MAHMTFEPPGLGVSMTIGLKEKPTVRAYRITNVTRHVGASEAEGLVIIHGEARDPSGWEK